ncbi:MAG: N-acetyltransferase [Candidatus Anammoxibacter sp.]
MYRKAVTNDVEFIQKLINGFAAENLMLPRSLSEIYENLRDYYVCADDDTITGCAALHIYWKDLAEIRSIAVNKSSQKKGIATKLIKMCIEEAQSLNIKKMFVLTYLPEFFEIFGFCRITKEDLPHKIWTECVRCHKFPDCTEIPLLLELQGD